MRLPDPALVLLVGAAGSGKSTWAHQHYRAVEIVSSDALRAVVGSGTADLERHHVPGDWCGDGFARLAGARR